MNAITIAFIIGVISIICIGIWLMKGTIDFIAERNEQYRKDTIKDNQFEIDADGTETKKDIDTQPIGRSYNEILPRSKVS